MTVSIDTTSKKYHGAMAANYEDKRTPQIRWGIENEEVERLLKLLHPRSVLDVPVGTGRFIPVYERIRPNRVIGIDVSSSMLAQAAAKISPRMKKRVELICEDVRNIDVQRVDVTVCVRFLDLIDEEAMQSVMMRLMELSKKAIICTIRFGKRYVPKSNTSEHDEMKFRKLLRQNGWKVAETTAVFTAGWHILLLTPKKGK